jgi:hypothetical protein
VKSNIDDQVRVARILTLLDEDDRVWLEDRLAEPWQRRARRLAERDLKIREFAVNFHPLLSGRAMAVAISVAINRYRASAWRFERDLPAPADQRRRSLWAILHLNGGRSLSEGRVRYALAGVVIAAGSRKSRKQATAADRSVGLGLKSGTNWNASSGEATNR